MSRRGDGPDEPSRDSELDARWQDIIAQLGESSSSDDEPWTDPQQAGRRRTDPPGRTVRQARLPAEDSSEDLPHEGEDAPRISASDPRAWAPDPARDEAEDHFEPPEPEPVFGGDPLLTVAWIVAIGVPVLAVAALIFWRDVPSLVLQAAGAAFLGAIGLLLWRMPHERDDEDDDPGAVV